MPSTLKRTHTVGLALAATVLLLSEPTALAESPAQPAQEPSRPSKPVATGTGNPREQPETFSLFDRALATTPRKSIFDSWLSGVEIKCVGCPGSETSTMFPESRN